MIVEGSFKIRRYWLHFNTPESVLATLNWRMGTYKTPKVYATWGRAPYVDINYYGDSDRNLTLMELKYADHILDREEIVYTVEGDDGLTPGEDCV